MIDIGGTPISVHAGTLVDEPEAGTAARGVGAPRPAAATGRARDRARAAGRRGRAPVGPRRRLASRGARVDLDLRGKAARERTFRGGAPRRPAPFRHGPPEVRGQVPGTPRHDRPRAWTGGRSRTRGQGGGSTGPAATSRSSNERFPPAVRTGA